MLTLAKVSNGAAAASYYQNADDYYTGDQSPSRWWGDGAERLGLSGAVDAEQFRALLDGRMPNGEEIHNAAAGRRGGTDLTFSAPKSVSLQALVGGDRRLVDAHELAVQRTLAYAQDLASCRVTEAGITRSEATRNLIVATFRHETSRAQEPQLHTHSVVINATQRAYGQWRAVDHAEFYRQQRLMGALYRSELALAVKELGYEVKLTHNDGRFELGHFSDKQLDAFSSRSAAIEAALAKQGLDRDSASAHAKEKATLATRERKVEIDRAQLHAQWRDTSREHGIDYAPALRAIVVERDARLEAAERAVNWSVAHATERQAVVSESQLVRSALERGTGRSDLASVRQAIENAVQRIELIRDGERYTTPEAQRLERETLAIEQRGRAAVAPILSERDAAHVTADKGLSAGQRTAARMILSTDSRVAAIQGSAGVGKTTMLAAAKEIAHRNGWQVVGLAPSAAAARELGQANIRAETLAAFNARERSGLTERSVVVLDEAGMVSTRDMHALLSQVEQAGARAILVGDVQQLKAIEAGKPFAQLQEHGIARVEVDQIQRQTDATLLRAVTLAAHGDVGRSIEELRGRVVEIDRTIERYSTIAKDYAALDPAAREGTRILAGTHAAREHINANVREALQLAGHGMSIVTLERKDLTQAQARSSLSYQPGDLVQAGKHYESLGLKRGDFATVIDRAPGTVTLQRADGEYVQWKPAVQSHLIAYHSHEREMTVGDQVRFTANDYATGVINGDRGHVVGIDNGTLRVHTSDGRTIALDTAKPQAIEHGYCSTIHSAQGQTCDRVLIDADTRSATANESAYYVAISRAREDVRLYTDDKAMLPEAMSRLDNKTAALEIVPRSERELTME